MKTKDLLPLAGIDFIEFYVSNAKQSAHYYQTVFGFQPQVLQHRSLEVYQLICS